MAFANPKEMILCFGPVETVGLTVAASDSFGSSLLCYAPLTLLVFKRAYRNAIEKDISVLLKEVVAIIKDALHIELSHTFIFWVIQVMYQFISVFSQFCHIRKQL